MALYALAFLCVCWARRRRTAERQTTGQGVRSWRVVLGEPDWPGPAALGTPVGDRRTEAPAGQGDTAPAEGC
jgi:hypothetical protein